MISETSIDDTFPGAQFGVEGYFSYRHDRTSQEGDILLYVQEDIPSKYVGFFIEIILRKKKWVFCSYNRNKDKIFTNLQLVTNDLHSS